MTGKLHLRNEPLSDFRRIPWLIWKFLFLPCDHTLVLWAACCMTENHVKKHPCPAPACDQNLPGSRPQAFYSTFNNCTWRGRRLRWMHAWYFFLIVMSRLFIAIKSNSQSSSQVWCIYKKIFVGSCPTNKSQHKFIYTTKYFLERQFSYMNSVLT